MIHFPDILTPTKFNIDTLDTQTIQLDLLVKLKGVTFSKPYFLVSNLQFRVCKEILLDGMTGAPQQTQKCQLSNVQNPVDIPLY